LIEELISEELELEALSRRQAAADEQHSHQLRQKQRDQLIDDLVCPLRHTATDSTFTELSSRATG